MRGADTANKVKAGRWIRRSIVVFFGASAIVAVIVAIAATTTSLPSIGAKAARFSGVMQVVRPLVLLGILLLWRPGFHWLRQRSWVSSRVHRRAVAIWPQLMIWTCLIELTLGQGYVVIGGAAVVLYGLYRHFQGDRGHDRR